MKTGLGKGGPYDGETQKWLVGVIFRNRLDNTCLNSDVFLTDMGEGSGSQSAGNTQHILIFILEGTYPIVSYFLLSHLTG